MIPRRIFLKNGALALVGTGMIPGFLFRTVLAAPGENRRDKILVVIFQRGGLDALNTLVPFAEKRYYRFRPTIAVPAPSKDQESALDLDGSFGLHPSLEPLRKLYGEGDLAILRAVGSPHATRSHFDAQDFMESAAPGNKRITDGWLNRFLAQDAGLDIPFRGVAIGTRLPRSLRGHARTVALADTRHFDLNAGRLHQQIRSAYQSLYDRDSNSLLSGTARDLFEAVDFLKHANPGQYKPRGGARYPEGAFGRDLSQVAQLIKANIGLQIAFVDFGGWDHHINEGGSQGQLSSLLQELAQGLAAFYHDLDDRMEEIVMLTMSEFGRTVSENGNAGTDHGHGGVMLVLGASVKGGNLYGRWPGLEREQLFEGRDLVVTTDFREVLAEILHKHLGCVDLDRVFPGFPVDSQRFPGVL